MDKVLGAFLFIKARLGEPGTHAALTGVCAMAGVKYPEGNINDIFTVLTLGFGVAGFFLKEAKPLTQV